MHSLLRAVHTARSVSRGSLDSRGSLRLWATQILSMPNSSLWRVTGVTDTETRFLARAPQGPCPRLCTPPAGWRARGAAAGLPARLPRAHPFIHAPAARARAAAAGGDGARRGSPRSASQPDAARRRRRRLDEGARALPQPPPAAAQALLSPPPPRPGHDGAVAPPALPGSSSRCAEHHVVATPDEESAAAAASTAASMPVATAAATPTAPTAVASLRCDDGRGALWPCATAAVRGSLHAQAAAVVRLHARAVAVPPFQRTRWASSRRRIVMPNCWWLATMRRRRAGNKSRPDLATLSGPSSR